MVAAQGVAGGLPMFWYSDIGMECLWKMDRMICCEVKPLNRDRT